MQQSKIKQSVKQYSNNICYLTIIFTAPSCFKWQSSLIKCIYLGIVCDRDTRNIKHTVALFQTSLHCPRMCTWTKQLGIRNSHTFHIFDNTHNLDWRIAVTHRASFHLIILQTLFEEVSSQKKLFFIYSNQNQIFYHFLFRKYSYTKISRNWTEIWFSLCNVLYFKPTSTAGILIQLLPLQKQES